MASTKFVVGFSRLDGAFRHAEVNKGTKLGALLGKFGYAPAEVAKAIPDVRVNGEYKEQGADYELQPDDVVSVVPNVKGGAQ